MSRWNPQPAHERVLARVKVGDCWLFQGYRLPDGYGRVVVSRGQGHALAHRAVWEALVGPISDEMQLDHLCRVRHCVNPDHLEPVTRLENVQRGLKNLTHCKYGHPFDRIYADRRDCSTCKNRRGREAKARRRAEVEARNQITATREDT